MNKVYLLTDTFEGAVNEFDSWEKVKQELEAFIEENPYSAHDVFIIVADATEIDLFDSDLNNVETVYLRSGCGEHAIYWADDFCSFKAFKKELIHQDIFYAEEELYYDMFSLTNIKMYQGEITIKIEEIKRSDN